MRSGRDASSRACAACWSAWSPAPMRCCKRIRKDIKIEQVFATARKDASDYGIAGHFPFIVGFPDESDASIQRQPGCGQAAARDEPGLPDARSSISSRIRAASSSSRPWRAASSCRETLEAWAQLRLRGRPARALGVARRSSSSSSASSSSTSWRGSARRPASDCCRSSRVIAAARDDYRWPVEMLFTRWLVPAQKLS